MVDSERDIGEFDKGISLSHIQVFEMVTENDIKVELVVGFVEKGRCVGVSIVGCIEGVAIA